MTRMNVAVELDGNQLAQFNASSQADWWIGKVSEASVLTRDRYKIVPITDALTKYKREVFDAVMQYASDPHCGTVNEFLSAVNINRADYYEESEYVVSVKAEEGFDKYQLIDMLQQGIDQGGHDYEVTEFNVRMR